LPLLFRQEAVGELPTAFRQAQKYVLCKSIKRMFRARNDKKWEKWKILGGKLGK